MTTSHGKVIHLASRTERMGAKFGLKLQSIIVWSMVGAFCASVWLGLIWLMHRMGV